MTSFPDSLDMLSNLKNVFLSLTLFSFFSCTYAQNHTQNEQWLRDEKVALQASVLLNNSKRVVPLTSIQSLKIASIDLGFNHSVVFDSLLNKYVKVDHFNGNTYVAISSLNALLDDLKFYNTLVLEISDVSVFDQRVLNFILEVEKNRKVIIALFGDGRSLVKLDLVQSPIIWCATHTPAAASIVAQAIFGGIDLNNTLRDTYTSNFKAGDGYPISKIRLKYTVPEDVGINAADLDKIDAIAREAISQRATPGAVVLVVKDGSVIYNKAFGNHTYANNRPVKVDDIYDLASVTKISATTLGVMRLVEEGKLNLDSTLYNYLGRTRNTEKQYIRLKEVMLHQAGFTPFIPFYDRLKATDHSRDSSGEFSTKVADNYFLRKNYYEEVMWPQMLNARLVSRARYVYSDLSMYYMKEVIEGIAHEPMDQYVLEQFYNPLGMQTAGFNPRTRFDKNKIVPTEEDTYFRNTLVQGYVHDQGAALAGGIAGHAGLFSNANDLAILFQMMLNKGTYGGQRYFKPETVDLFTAKQFEVSRRSLGFDRRDPEASKNYPSQFASSSTYGHTGYTGTCIWVDPQYKMIYIFLSNRVYPKVTDKLSDLKIRPRIQDAIYEALRKSR